MNPRPILIATCCAIALVAFVYFFGKQHFSDGDDIIDEATRKPSSSLVSVDKLPTTSESLSSSPSTEDSTVTSGKVVVEHSDSLPDKSSVPSDSETQTDPSLSENFKERVRLFNAYNAMMDKIDSYVEPDEKDFENQDDYYDAVIKHLDLTIPLHEQAYDLHIQYIRISYTPEEFGKMANLFREQARDYYPNMTNEEIESLIQELRPR